MRSTETPKTFLYSYTFRGERYGLDVEAATREEAEFRVQAMGTAKCDGEMVLRLPVDAPGSFFLGLMIGTSLMFVGAIIALQVLG